MRHPATPNPARPLSRLVVRTALATLCVAAGLDRLVAGEAGHRAGSTGHMLEPSAIHVFGDSLSDTGRTFAALGIPPAPYFEGRFSNGPVWVEYLAPALGLDYEPLENFAWAGADTGRTNSYAGLPGMLDEVDEYMAGLGRFPRADKQAVYVVFGGANDFLRILQADEDPTTVIGEAVGNIAIIVRRLHRLGAEHIVVVDLPDIGLTPRVQSLGAEAVLTATSLSCLFNITLDAALDGLHSDAIVRVSAFDLLGRIAAAPEAYGFTDVVTPGIFAPDGGDTHLFWDDIHPTTRAHVLLAEAIAAALDRAEKMRPHMHPGPSDARTAFAMACASP